MRYLIIGASSGLGRELAYVFAQNNCDLVICSRSEKDLNTIKSDIETRYKKKIEVIQIDFSSLEEVEEKIINNINLKKNIDGILFPVGMMIDKDDTLTDIKERTKINNSNYLSISHTISNFSKNLSIDDNISFTGFGSVSGYLGRKINVSYAASKRALESYFESLSFSTQNTSANIQFYILGYIDTGLAFGQNLKIPKGNINKLAKIVYKNRNKKYKKLYYPSIWILICKLLLVMPLNILKIIQRIYK